MKVLKVQSATSLVTLATTFEHMFTSQLNGAHIDIPQALEGAHVVDKWNLATYFGSLGKTGEKFLFSEIATRAGPIEDRAELWIQKLVQCGTLVACSSPTVAYKLVLPIQPEA